jgi:predicted enzyme involved in methoxymalonyl-ACP biosynthesis
LKNISVEEKKATIENYLLSCRVLGKKIEQKFLLTIEDYLLQNGIIINKIHFKESEKNLPAKTFIKETKYGSIVKQIK